VPGVAGPLPSWPTAPERPGSWIYCSPTSPVHRSLRI
jgi:hypothetical protein